MDSKTETGPRVELLLGRQVPKGSKGQWPVPLLPLSFALSRPRGRCLCSTEDAETRRRPTAPQPRHPFLPHMLPPRSWRERGFRRLLPRKGEHPEPGWRHTGLTHPTAENREVDTRGGGVKWRKKKSMIQVKELREGTRLSAEDTGVRGFPQPQG